MFLCAMERVVPWSALCALIEPDDPKPGDPKPDDPKPGDPKPGDPKPGDGRPPIGVERMLRLYFWQQWFNLSDPAVEEAVYDWQAMRRVVGIDLGRAPVPDETTACRLRHRLEAHDLGRRLFDAVQRHLAENGLKRATGMIVDAVLAKAGIIKRVFGFAKSLPLA